MQEAPAVGWGDGRGFACRPALRLQVSIKKVRQPTALRLPVLPGWQLLYFSELKERSG